ncbi:WD40/YVTN/BNR-like repeat-containing protein [Arundinibacter roseus]|nr:hypothetical protein [Arundinibacter roseus]
MSLVLLIIFQFNFAFDRKIEFPKASPVSESQPKQMSFPSVSTYTILKSFDGGFTWQQIGDGLPADLKEEGFFVNEQGFYLQAGKVVFHNKSNSTGAQWEKVPVEVRESKIVKSNGVFMATSQKGIIRSSDQGKTWEVVLNEGGVGIAVEPIKGGFAAINYNTESKTRRVRITYDGGRNWQAIDAGLPPSLTISSIVQVGEYFYCGHPEGIFRSSDAGKSWVLILTSIEDKVFNLAVSGKVMYAIPRAGGC